MVTDKNIDDFDARMDALLRLPRFSPSADFSDRVVSRLAVFQQPDSFGLAEQPRTHHRPSRKLVEAQWALPPSLSRWIPASTAARYAAGALAIVTSFATTAAAVVIAVNFGLASFLGGLALDRTADALAILGGDLLNTLLGPGTLNVPAASGPAQAALMAGGLALGGITALAGLSKAAAVNPRGVGS